MVVLVRLLLFTLLFGTTFSGAYGIQTGGFVQLGGTLTGSDPLGALSTKDFFESDQPLDGHLLTASLSHISCQDLNLSHATLAWRIARNGVFMQVVGQGLLGMDKYYYTDIKGTDLSQQSAEVFASYQGDQQAKIEWPSLSYTLKFEPFQTVGIGYEWRDQDWKFLTELYSVREYREASVGAVERYTAQLCAQRLLIDKGVAKLYLQGSTALNLRPMHSEQWNYKKYFGAKSVQKDFVQISSETTISSLIGLRAVWRSIELAVSYGCDWWRSNLAVKYLNDQYDEPNYFMSKIKAIDQDKGQGLRYSLPRVPVNRDFVSPGGLQLRGAMQASIVVRWGGWFAKLSTDLGTKSEWQPGVMMLVGYRF